MRTKLRFELAVAVFVLVAAGAATLALNGAYSSTVSGDDVVTDSVASDRIDYEGGAMKYVASVETFARAVQAHQLTELSKAVEAQKAAARAAVAKSKPTYQPTPRQYINQPASIPSGSVWDRLAQCESGGNWSINTGNGYSGGLQFAHSSWRGFGGTEFAPMAYQATREQQIVVAERILASSGWGAWPACSRKLGLR